MENLDSSSKNVKTLPGDDVNPQFPLSMTNYKLLAIGLVVIIIGFVLMAGGGSDDPNVFNEDVYSFRRITLAPIVVLAGFIFEIYAIMKK